MTLGQLVYRRKDAARVVGLSVSAIEKLSRAGKFPVPVQLTARSVGWRHADLASWVAALPSVTDQTGA